MNFLLRSPQPAASELPPPVKEKNADSNAFAKPATALEGLINEDPFRQSEASEDKGEINGIGSPDGVFRGQSSIADVPIVDKHLDVSEEEGWIIIPCSMSSSLYITMPQHCSKTSSQLRIWMDMCNYVRVSKFLGPGALHEELMTEFGHRYTNTSKY